MENLFSLLVFIKITFSSLIIIPTIAGSVLVSLALLVPAILATVYLLVFQSYVLRLEAILSSVYLGMLGLQMVFGLICAATFYKAN